MRLSALTSPGAIIRRVSDGSDGILRTSLSCGGSDSLHSPKWRKSPTFSTLLLSRCDAVQVHTCQPAFVLSMEEEQHDNHCQNTALQGRRQWPGPSLRRYDMPPLHSVVDFCGYAHHDHAPACPAFR